MKLLDIGHVSEQSGVSPSALRYYEEIALISPVARKGLRRQYAPDVLLQLALIAMGKSAGFSLDDIAGMFGGNGQPDLPRPALHQKADEIDRQIRRLRALRDTLHHVADCPARSHLECPTFRRLVRAAGKRHKTGPRTGRKPAAS
jgi:DNA-binding transcriptional MerR regulator